MEDEYHIFFICSKYNTLREEYLNTWYQFGDSRIDNFYNIISTSNPVEIRKLCLYIDALLESKYSE